MRLNRWSVALFAVASLAAWMVSPALANGKGRGGGYGGGGGRNWRPPNNCRPNNPPPRRNVRRDNYTNWNLGLGLGFGDGYSGGGYGMNYYGGSAQWVPDYGRYYSVQGCGCQSSYHYTTCNQYSAPAVREYHYRTVYQPIYQSAPARTTTRVKVKVQVDNRTTTRRSYIAEEDDDEHEDDDAYVEDDDADVDEDEDRDQCRHKKQCSKRQQCSNRRNDRDYGRTSDRDNDRGGYWSNRLRDRDRRTN